MTNEEILKIALRQSAIDCNCREEDFFYEKGKVVRSAANPLARKYLSLPFECDMVSYGSCVVAQTSERTEQAVREYIENILRSIALKRRIFMRLTKNSRRMG